MTAISGIASASSSWQSAKTGVPGDRLKPGEVKDGASASASNVSDSTKTGMPGDRTKPGEVKGTNPISLSSAAPSLTTPATSLNEYLFLLMSSPADEQA